MMKKRFVPIIHSLRIDRFSLSPFGADWIPIDIYEIQYNLLYSSGNNSFSIRQLYRILSFFFVSNREPQNGSKSLVRCVF